MSRLFLPLVVTALVLPLLVGLVLVPIDSTKFKSDIPATVGEWQGRKLCLTPDIVKNYAPLDNRLTWLRYSRDKAPFVECIIQEATNYNNLHNLYMCLVYSKSSPKRVAIVDTPGRANEKSVLFEFVHQGTEYCALFSYQTRSGYAIYPAESIPEKLGLLMFARKPCRLIEIATPVVSSREEAIDRLKYVASGVCGSAL